MLQKALGALFVFGIAPVCTGLLWTKGRKEEKHRSDYIYLAGFLTQLAVFQVLAVPVMILDAYGMDLLVGLTTSALALLSVCGVVSAIWERCKGASVQGSADSGSQGGVARSVHENGVPGCAARPLQEDGVQSSAARSLQGNGIQNGVTRSLQGSRRFLSSFSTECKLFWLLAFAAVIFQMYMGFAYASFDGDDSYYVVQSVLADQTGVLNRIRPYTGLSTDLDIRHALATLPLWEAYVARMTGIHATIVAHSLLPLVLIPLTYLCYFEIGRKLLGVRDVRLPIFMVLVSLMQIWGNSSIYTNATFFLTRTWQGKSVLANLVLLVQIWLLLEIFDEKEPSSKGHFWGLLVVNNVVAAMMTSMGAFLAGMFLGIAGLVAAIRQRNPAVLWKAVLCCVPNVIYLVLLLVL